MRNMSASVVSNNLYDVFGVLRYQQGSAETPWRWRQGANADEALLLTTRKHRSFYLPNRVVILQKGGAISVTARQPSEDRIRGLSVTRSSTSGMANPNGAKKQL
ncbi:MAG: hypothetical protein KatS3mg022_1536 [Armatimonadota bacterium]|nr:MAG: hypothetical protein KatS3mg022_1536 [Armatimonadota bacterium]